MCPRVARDLDFGLSLHTNVYFFEGKIKAGTQLWLLGRGRKILLRKRYKTGSSRSGRLYEEGLGPWQPSKLLTSILWQMYRH